MGFGAVNRYDIKVISGPRPIACFVGVWTQSSRSHLESIPSLSSKE
ncbi:hypothetical protein J0895_03920 [Phormidium pseudopriestleyi FRX01]|uniref:Uncharacterized protein n=1 Tax=Phormidium pseudopriestleyi FRX01 TaxID=1759528 RepID=A0ABS3FMD1_9CYAN|nr:hypothetical protein [Phormidium pseudopriestleyi]MBO0348262.1 hypothetical protein [Phormidium pseudopriestleyi FRX01]